jgi:hypothetical protein
MLHHALTHYLVHRGFNKERGDSLAMAVLSTLPTLPKVNTNRTSPARPRPPTPVPIQLTLGDLSPNGQPHGEMKPIQNVFGFQADELC